MTYIGPTDMPEPPVTGKLSLLELAEMKRQGHRMTMLTVCDAPGARLAEAAGVELVLVGDSTAMTVLGYDSTLPVTIDEMLMFTRAVTRGAHRPIVVVDLPLGAVRISDESAVEHAVRLIKDGGADAVKIEAGGGLAGRARAMVDAGLPVMGHIGLTAAQSPTLPGGYDAQGPTEPTAQGLLQDARALEEAGCFAVVLEALPAPVAAGITEALRIPTIGIGSGPSCDGQVLVWHDLLGLTPGRLPRFATQYTDLSSAILAALESYVADVRAGRFPERQHTYAMPQQELDLFEATLGPRRHPV